MFCSQGLGQLGFHEWPLLYLFICYCFTHSIKKLPEMGTFKSGEREREEAAPERSAFNHTIISTGVHNGNKLQR